MPSGRPKPRPCAGTRSDGWVAQPVRAMPVLRGGGRKYNRHKRHLLSARATTGRNLKKVKCRSTAPTAASGRRIVAVRHVPRSARCCPLPHACRSTTPASRSSANRSVQIAPNRANCPVDRPGCCSATAASAGRFVAGCVCRRERRRSKPAGASLRANRGPGTHRR